jgi:hypothetical protein
VTLASALQSLTENAIPIPFQLEPAGHSSSAEQSRCRSVQLACDGLCSVVQHEVQRRFVIGPGENLGGLARDGHSGRSQGDVGRDVVTPEPAQHFIGERNATVDDAA